jgi:hypothetical protein
MAVGIYTIVILCRKNVQNLLKFSEPGTGDGNAGAGGGYNGV